MTLASFGLAALVFVTLLVVTSFSVSSISSTTLKPLGMTGSAVRTFSGYILILVGGWFILLAFLPSPIIGA